MAQPIETVYRDFVTDGNPASGFHDPVKSDIRNLLNAHLVNLTGATSGSIVKSSLSDLNGDLAYDADTMAWVVGDSTQGNDGVYQKQGASGAGSWTRLKDLPYNVIQLNNANAGTANAIQATTAINVPDAAYGALLVLNITAANTGAVTLSVNSETAKSVITNTGAAIPSGYFVAGMAVLCVDDGTSYRLMSYGDASAIQAAAEAAADEAEQYRPRLIHPEAYGAVGDGLTDDSAAFVAAFAANTVVHGSPGKIYAIKDVDLDGRVFDGSNCLLRDVSGAKYIFKLTGFNPQVRNFSIQDQGNIVRSTTMASAASASDTVLSVSSSTNMEIGQYIFVDQDNGDYHYSVITGISGTDITIRDGLVDAVSSGADVRVCYASLWVESATDWHLHNILHINGDACISVKPLDTSEISNKGTLRDVSLIGAKTFGFIKCENAAGVKVSNLKAWCGYVDEVSYTGDGSTDTFDIQNDVFLKRDVTVYVDDVLQTRDTDWEYNGNQVRFLSGSVPANGADILIQHFKDGLFGLVEDQRNTSVISGGNNYSQIEILDAEGGIKCFEGDLCDFDEVIIDTISKTALELNSCTDSLVFGKMFIGFSSRCVAAFSTNGTSLRGLYTKRVPTSEVRSGTVLENILLDNSTLSISADAWAGGDYAVAVQNNGRASLKGGQVDHIANIDDIPAGQSNVYLEDYGAVPITAMFDRHIFYWTVATNTAPGSGESYTYDLMINGSVAETLTISGASSYSASTYLQGYAQQGQSISVRITTSSGAQTTTTHRIGILGS